MRSFKKLNARGSSHLVALMLVVVLTGIGGSAYLLLTHADSLQPSTTNTTTTSSKLVTISALNWQTYTRASVVVDGKSSDGTSNKVVKLAAAQSVPSLGGYYGGNITTTAQKKGTNGQYTPVQLPKLEAFLEANLGKPASICIQAKGGLATSGFELEIDGFAQESNSYFKLFPNLGTTYTKRCIDFTIVSKKDYATRVNSNQYPNNISITNPASLIGPRAAADPKDVVYIDYVTVRLR